ncbi:MAG: J domain-containing protein [Kofleriaceae bacterium]
MKVDAYPLQWPAGWRRTPVAERVRARFARKERQFRDYGNGNTSSWTTNKQLSIADAVHRVRQALERFGFNDDDIVISSNLGLRLDGLPRSGQREPADPGVAVYWRDAAVTQAMAIDQYDRVADNLAAVAATIDAMRAIERHGGAQILNRAFQGFKALPSEATPSMDAATAAIVLSNYSSTLSQGEVLRSWEAARTAVRAARAKEHPDRGGDVARWHNVEVAKAVLEAHHGREL